MPTNEKLLEQRTTWLKARAALAEREKERTVGIERLDAAVERAKERVATDRAKLEEMVAQERNAADEYLREIEAPEAAAAEAFIQDQERRAAPPPREEPQQSDDDLSVVPARRVALEGKPEGIGPTDRH